MAEVQRNASGHFNIRHGLARTDEYKIWERMISRCHNPDDTNFFRYGQCGIVVCQPWRDSIERFIADVGPRPSKRHSLDRYPNQNGNYEPGNVRWATNKEQCRNQRTNRILTHGGESLTIAEWAERLGFARSVIHNRILYGWSVERALTTPGDAREKSVTVHGETMLLSQWAKRLGLSPSTITGRINRGWSPELAVSTGRTR